ncbi:MAG: TadE/TadG family type IV pilus assembly protein [Myxococcota bacterium]
MRRGANAIEFALTLPFVLLLLVGSTDFAWWSFSRQAVSRAVQDGAREASRTILPADAKTGAPITDKAEMTTREALDLWGLDSSTATVTATWTPDLSGRMWLRVHAAVPYQSLFGLPFVGSQVSRTFVVYTQEQNNPVGP